jgi:pseudouridine synthase
VKEIPDQNEDSGGTLRLQKYIADSGLCSRRNAEALIFQGEVWVNGKVAKPGTKVTPGVDRVTVSGKNVRTQAQPKITLAINKPRGLICSNDDPHNPETIFKLLPREYNRFRFFCAGRLDKDSEGLVILTTDGDLANRLMHPSNEVVKRYHVSLKEPYPSTRLKRLVSGLTFEGERLKVERAAIIKAPRRNRQGAGRPHAPREEARDPPPLLRARLHGAAAQALSDWQRATKGNPVAGGETTCFKGDRTAFRGAKDSERAVPGDLRKELPTP